MGARLNSRILLLAIAGFFLGGCEEKCVPSKEINCNVNQIIYKDLAVGMPIEKAESRLGSPYLFRPEIAPDSKGVGKYIWLKLMASDAKGRQVKIVVETKGGIVVSKNIEEYSM